MCEYAKPRHFCLLFIYQRLDNNVQLVIVSTKSTIKMTRAEKQTEQLVS